MKPRAAALSVILALALLAAPVPSNGQQPAKVYRIGYLLPSAGGYEAGPQHCPIQGKGTPNWQAFVNGKGTLPGNAGYDLVRRLMPRARKKIPDTS